MKKEKDKAGSNQKKTGILLLIAIAMAAAVFILISIGRSGSSEDTTIHIMLDAGHGGDNSGIQGYASEDAFDEHVVDVLEQKLEKDSHFTVSRTHEDGTAVSVADRAEKINEEKPDIVLSIHCAGNPDASKSGARIFAEIPSSRYHDASLTLAQAIQTEMNNEQDASTAGYFYYQPIKDGSVYQEHIVGLDDTTDYQQETFDLMQQAEVPVVLVEHMYATNQQDVQKWDNEEGYEKAADLYYRALQAVYEK